MVIDSGNLKIPIRYQLPDQPVQIGPDTWIALSHRLLDPDVFEPIGKPAQ